jgi:predicted transcriptional regulator
MMETKRSKLAIYIDVLKVLRNQGPSNIPSIMLKANLNSNVLTEYLGFLVSQSVIEKNTTCGEQAVFVIKQQGVNFLKYFKEL